MDFTADLSWIAFAFLCLALLWLAKVLFDARAKANGFAADAEIEEKSSLAVGIQRAGLYLAVPLTLSGTLGDSSTGTLVNDLPWSRSFVVMVWSRWTHREITGTKATSIRHSPL